MDRTHDEPDNPAETADITEDLSSNESTLADLEAEPSDSEEKTETKTVVKEERPSRMESFTKKFASSSTAVESRPEDEKRGARKFLFAYITSVFSALALLSGIGYLGYVLAAHFIDTAPKAASSSIFTSFIDFAPVYTWVMALLLVFGGLYLATSWFVAKNVANDNVSVQDWRIYHVVYGIFAATLAVYAASVVASFVYIPLSQMIAVDDQESTKVMIAVVGGLNLLLWIGVLVAQERLVRRGKLTLPLGGAVVAGVLLIVVLTGVFPIGSKANERADKRTIADLTAIESQINEYKADHKGELPDKLTALTFESKKLQSRLGNYEYTVKEKKVTVPTPQPSSTSSSTSTSDILKGLSSKSINSSSLQSYSFGSESASSLSSLFGATKVTSKPTKYYEICAVFKTDTSATKESSSTSALSLNTLFGGGKDSFNRHKAERTCFTRDN